MSSRRTCLNCGHPVAKAPNLAVKAAWLSFFTFSFLCVILVGMLFVDSGHSPTAPTIDQSLNIQESVMVTQPRHRPDTVAETLTNPEYLKNRLSITVDVYNKITTKPAGKVWVEDVVSPNTLTVSYIIEQDSKKTITTRDILIDGLGDPELFNSTTVWVECVKAKMIKALVKQVKGRYVYLERSPHAGKQEELQNNKLLRVVLIDMAMPGDTDKMSNIANILGTVGQVFVLPDDCYDFWEDDMTTG